MRSIFFALLTIAAVGVVGAAPTVAVGTRYPFCLQGNEFPALSNCTFSSYQQCQASASGRFLQGITNPYYVAGARRRSPARGLFLVTQWILPG
jgi:hypothetical protein